MIKKAEKKDIDTQREKCAIWVANEFFKYANWDEKNIDLNIAQYQTWGPYKKDAERLANELPDYQRNEVNLLLDEAIEQISAILNGEVKRPNSPVVEWSNITIKGDRFMSGDTPIFINRNNRTPKEILSPYSGMLGGASLNMSMMGANGKLTAKAQKDIDELAQSYSGSIFMGHYAPPAWMRQKDAKVTDGKRHFTSYDIDNPLVRETWSNLFREAVPQYAGKKCTDLGYMMANEPHWVTIKKSWAAGNFSDYTMAKFRVWLKEQHKSISVLNKRWGSSYGSFDEIVVEVPFDRVLRGQPKGYDIMKFNQDRVYDWFKFLADGIKKYDKTAKVHIKAVPRLFRQDIRDHGMDMERLTELSDVIGNDAKITGRLVNQKGVVDWEADYCYEWMDVAINFDFFHSVSPEKANINTESHYLSSSGYRDIYLSKEFTRSSYWLATLQGMDVSYTWFWAREADGAIHPNLRPGVKQVDNAMAKAYVGSLAQQPRVTHELAKTYFDLNCYGDEINKLQNLRRPMRLFYSEISAINMSDYMKRMIDLYTPIFFEGNPVGFVTEGIINKQDNKLWDVVVVKNAPFVLESEIKALQNYVDGGGTVLIDSVSLKMNQYGEPHTLKLKKGKGKIITLSTDAQFISASNDILTACGSLPALALSEVNSKAAKGCVWRVLEKDANTDIMAVINIGSGDASLQIKDRAAKKIISVKNMYTGAQVGTSFKMKPHDVLLLEVKKR